VSLDDSTLALQVLEQNHFDLVFLDVEMPKPNGIEVCERLRKMPTNSATPVVFVTAHSDFGSRARSSSSGGNDFIAKPFLSLELAVKTLTWLFKEDGQSQATFGPGAISSVTYENQETPPSSALTPPSVVLV
jgi:CheY-like chemotaxis protein